MPKSLLAVAILVLAGCGGDDPIVFSSETAEPAWRVDVIFQAPAKLGGCAIGDVDPTKPGLEIAAVSGNGDVWVIARDGAEWSGERIATLPGEMIQCAVGDARLDRPGDELVVGGMASGGEDGGGPGQAWLFSRGEEGWEQEPVFQDTALIHGVAIADMDPERDGNQIVTVGFSDNAVVLDRVEGKGWVPIQTLPLGSPGKCVIPFDFGAAVECAGGPVKHVKRHDGAMQVKDIWRGTAGAARLGTAGWGLLVACDDGKLVLVETGEGEQGAWTIYQESQKLRGAALRKPDEDAWQAATAGYEKKVTLFRAARDGFEPVVVYEDGAKFHHLAADDLLPDRPGHELVACGYSGKVVLISRE